MLFDNVNRTYALMLLVDPYKFNVWLMVLLCIRFQLFSRIHKMGEHYKLQYTREIYSFKKMLFRLVVLTYTYHTVIHLYNINVTHLVLTFLCDVALL